METLTNRELEVLKILWAEEQPCTVKDILEIRPDLSRQTVAYVMNKLLKKKAIEVTGISRSGTVYARAYRPIVTEQEYLESLDILKEPPSLSELCSSFCRVSKDKEKVIDELEDILEEFRREVEGK